MWTTSAISSCVPTVWSRACSIACSAASPGADKNKKKSRRNRGTRSQYEHDRAPQRHLAFLDRCSTRRGVQRWCHGRHHYDYGVRIEAAERNEPGIVAADRADVCRIRSEFRFYRHLLEQPSSHDAGESAYTVLALVDSVYDKLARAKSNRGNSDRVVCFAATSRRTRLYVAAECARRRQRQGHRVRKGCRIGSEGESLLLFVVVAAMWVVPDRRLERVIVQRKDEGPI
uniref:Uncharacterized protein n=1 Tax=mine drainage metagenome TaxID=410659 RepID=E6Q2V7_9ZZZZ